jgi:hypothetical protein
MTPHKNKYPLTFSTNYMYLAVIRLIHNEIHRKKKVSNRNPFKNWVELRSSGRLSSSCF